MVDVGGITTARIATAAVSLSTIVTVPVPRPIVTPPVGLESTRRNTSSPSSSLSPTIVTVKVAVVCPAAKVTVPVAAW
ncbi:MAG: hypothetical protein JWN32_1742 [Solirubrobacterales bacterium]|nr:hypothetical protein [Solirubrobacterales bacterium]